MCGVLGGSATFTPRLTLGYRDAVATSDSALHAAGSRAVGHEFHRTAVEFTRDYPPAWVFRAGSTSSAMRAVSDGAVLDGVHAAYLHTHAAAHPAAATRFAGAAVESSRAGEAGWDRDRVGEASKLGG
jgi:cobyrinic acid a,c-diamide synthase